MALKNRDAPLRIQIEYDTRVDYACEMHIPVIWIARNRRTVVPESEIGYTYASCRVCKSKPRRSDDRQ